MKRVYQPPMLHFFYVEARNLFATSITSTQNADGLEVGGTTSGSSITTGNVKGHTAVEWEDWE